MVCALSVGKHAVLPPTCQPLRPGLLASSIDFLKVFARGITMGSEFNPYLEPLRKPFWETAGEALRKVNKDFREDPRIDTVMLPLFDGITQIKWKEGHLDKLEN